MKRERWSSRTIFLFAAIGSAVGLGNVWRFPYMVQSYGGGAFLIPFLIAAFVIGIPMLILEYAIGQKFQQGAVRSFKKIHPRLGAIGIGAVLVGFVIITYYVALLAWTLIYLVKSFHSPLPWASNSEAFFHETVLGLTSSPNILGGIGIPLLMALAVTWIGIYFIVRHGVKSVGKVVIITMPLPIILLGVLLIRGLTLPGSLSGIAYYLKPDFAALLVPEIWLAAVSQVFFSFSLAFGIMIAYASFIDKKQDTVADSFITGISDVGISLFAGFVVFSILGYMAAVESVPISQVVQSGPGLAFVVFPEALSLMPMSWLFAAIFFLVLISLGIDSAFSIVEAVNTSIGDRYAKPNRPKIAFFTCLIGFILSLIFITGAGLYFLDTVDHFITNIGLITVGIFESIAIGWVYGADKLRTHINSITKHKLGKWWSISIKYIIPVALIILLAFQLYTEFTTPYENYPTWLLTVGWLSALIPLGIALALSFRK